MKTITIQGEDLNLKQINNISCHYNLGQKVETRIFVVNPHSILNKHHSELTDEEFMNLAGLQGGAYTLNNFQPLLNDGDLYIDESYIRFINVNI